MSSPRLGIRRQASSPSTALTPARPSTTRKSITEDMDYIIGDRILVGNKPGIIAYLGEVKFASGDFAGVVLDEAVGKNDGSVKGTRYFQCEPLRGVFVRTSKLVRNTSPNVRASPRLNQSAHRHSPSPKPTTNRSKSTSSASSGSTESKRLSPPTSISVVSPDAQNKTGNQVEQIQKEYETLMSGTRHKLEEFQLHIDKLEAENKELHKTIEEQKSHIEDLQFQLEEEILSKEDVMQELVNAKNNNQTDSPVQCDSDVKVRELQSQLAESVQVNSSLIDELEQVKTQLSDIEFQLAENESERENEVKEKKKMEEQIAGPESQSACRTAVTNQSDNSHCSPLAEQLAEKTRKLKTLQENYSKLEAKERQLQERINALESQHNLSSNQLVSQHKIDIDTLSNKHSIELHRLRNQHKHDISNTQQDHNRNILQLKSQHQALVKSLQQQLHEFHTNNARQSISSNSCGNCAAHLNQIDLLHRHSAELEASREGQLRDLSAQVDSLTAEKKQLRDAMETKSQMTDQLKQQVAKSQHQLTVWQAGIKKQMEANQLQSEQDLECLRTELEASQSLLGQLEKKLRLSETDNSRLKSNLRITSHELEQAKRGLAASLRSGETCNGTYRDTSDFLFNELKHQVEVMEVNMFRTTEEDLRLKEENEELRNELIRLKHAMSCKRQHGKRHSQPRIFCDTCGSFDLHLTLECTRPHSISTTTIPQHNGLPHSPSPTKQRYCNICDSQTHWTADCTADE